MFGLTKEELKLLKSLNTPRKLQKYLNDIPMNFEEDKETCLSPREVIKQNRAHCIEGAIFAALALRLNGDKPLILDLTTTEDDFDHVVALFKEDGCWGAISKTNHAVLRYRDPVYKTVRELVMIYFHEYYLNNGKKTLRSYSKPINLSKFDKKGWITSKGDVQFVPEHILNVKHFDILTKKQIAKLKKADDVEIAATEATEWHQTDE